MDIIETTKTEETITQHNETQNGFPRSASSNSKKDKNNKKMPKIMSSGLRKDAEKYPDYIRIEIEAEPKFPSEWWKTGIAIVYALFNLFLTAVMITVVHERVPPKETSPRLPDKLFPYIDRVKLAFYVTEINGMVLVGIWFMQWMLLRYKSIVCRRYCFIIGTLYLYRCITMYVTTLSVPGMYFECAPKFQLSGDFYGKAQRILTLISGGGLTIAGSHALCGDFLYSGHTVTLTLTYLFIKEYSPRQFWWYQLVCWLLSASGVIFIFVAREHYTVAVIVSYCITTRLFWWYHAMANEKDSSQWNFLSRAWWFPVFYFFEKNIKDRLPCSFSWPFSLPPSCFKTLCKKNSRFQKMREDIVNII